MFPFHLLKTQILALCAVVFTMIRLALSDQILQTAMRVLNREQRTHNLLESLAFRFRTFGSVHKEEKKDRTLSSDFHYDTFIGISTYVHFV